MTIIEANIRRTRWRVAVNDWLGCLGWCLLGAAGAWVIADLSDKLFELELPRRTVACGLAGLALLASTVWAWVKRPDSLTAAIILDKAAGLKERTSTGLCCLGSEDPFARAAVVDAESANRKVTPRVFIRLSWPSSLSWAGAALAGAVVVSLLPIGPLHAAEATHKEREEVLRAKVQRVQRRLQELQEKTEKNPALGELKSRLASIDQLPPEKLLTAESTRREAIKKIDSLADALKKEEGEREQVMKDVKRMFRGLKATQPPETPAEKLSQALAQGDFRSARQAVDAMREQLARMAQEEDPAKQKELQRQLQELAKKLEQAAQQKDRKEDLRKELEKSGIDPKTAERVLEQLTKEDLQKVQEELQKNGASKQQMNEMLQKLAAAQKSGQQGSELAEAMQKAAQAMQSSSAADAAAQLEQAADQLNSMEMLDQQLGELQSTLQDLQDMKNDMARSDPGNCPSCNGRGCSRCNSGGGQGRGGMGPKPGQGRGGRGPEEATGVAFQKVRTPVHTGEGAIIAKMFVDGEQVRGEVVSEAVELLTAAERDATDAISKQRVPNHYQGPIKKYFSGMLQDLKDSSAGESGEAADPQTEPDS